MASYSNPRRGFFTQSLLPQPSRKSKLQKKTRRGTLILDLIFSNMFTLGLSISFIFLIAVFLIYGVPTPISSRLHHAPPRVLRARNLTRAYAAGGDRSATVDVTMKDLYEKIEFLDEDGGAWKQGWVVSYSGDEWLDEKLKVFVVPHSHNDPGWKLTVEEYYQRQSRHILDTVVDALSKDSRRRFIWEEMSYLERWWRDSTKEKKNSFIRLVKSGQLEIVGGGWVMNDEANSHYYAILEQMTEGNVWLNETIGVVPKNSWAIDPFGYSPTMAYLLRRMGFENMLVQRTHYEVKKELALARNLEFVWRQSWDPEETTDIFVHMMPFYSYDIPHTCGPDPSVCCQFDFARAPPFSYERCPWGRHPLPITGDNVRERALLLLDQYRKKSVLYRTNTLLVPLGDDFRYVDGAEAEAQFRNYQLLFDRINSDPALRTDVRFGTLDEYFRGVREEAGRRNFSRPSEAGSAQIAGFPSLSGDFFTYADRNLDYWSGYYVSRPFFKAVDRVLEQTLRSAEIMMVFLLGYCQRPSCERFPVSFGHKLTAARRNLALFQHHDGVTGTAKDHVVADYGSRMHTSLHDLQIFMSKAVEVLLGIRHGKLDQLPAQFEAEIQRSEYDARAAHKVIHLRDGAAHQVVFFNPSAQARNEVVTVTLSRPDATVLTSARDCLPSQTSPEFRHARRRPFSGRHRLHWHASLPAFALQTFFITTASPRCSKSRPAHLTFYTNSSSAPCPAPYTCSNSDRPLADIATRHLRLKFDARLGLLREIVRPDGARVAVGEEVAMYTGSESGAYLFKPDGEAEPVVRSAAWFVVVDGPILREAFSYPETGWAAAPFSQSTRVYEGADSAQEHVVEKEYHVEMVGREFDNREMILRLRTDVDNRRIFYSDLNGFQMSRRETRDKIPVQGNYYPMPSLAFLQDPGGARLSLHSRQALGVAGLRGGWVEVMLDRRPAKDDGRGLGQGVTDNRPMDVVFHLLYESNVSAAADPSGGPAHPSLLSLLVGDRLEHPLLGFVSKKARDTSSVLGGRMFSPLAAPLPCDLQVVTMKAARPLRLPDRDGPRFALLLHRRRFDASYCREGRVGCARLGDGPLNLLDLFREMRVTEMKGASLNLVNENIESLGYAGPLEDTACEGNVLIAPMEIRAYRFDLSPRK